MRSRSGVAPVALATLMLAGLVFLPACGTSGQGNASPGSSPGETASAPSPSATPVSVSQLLDSATSVAGLRTQLKSIGPDALYGKPFREAPPAVIAALEDYFATVDPSAGELNNASRVEFVWAFTAVEAVGERSTSTRQIVDAYFHAEGDHMIYVGTIHPGYNNHLMHLSRQSTAKPWQVDGWYP
jgi:hypothetical protein